MPDHGQVSDHTHTSGLALGQQVTIRKLSSAGAPVFAYAGVIAHLWPTGARLDATWTRDEMALGYTTFEPGDHFHEWFFTDRWYNIMEVRGGGESLKGWYCNVSYPAEFEAGRISYRDLALDLWVAPDGGLTTLDEDEFAADLAIDDAARGQALDALDHLRALVARREVPFDRVP
ncbi:MAG TPA: DUF402 domain-containing protein [Ktedonobacterales bacterium]|nr:DUF402 domain-containing protein [Ktedonobacterales bacterium]